MQTAGTFTKDDGGRIAYRLADTWDPLRPDLRGHELWCGAQEARGAA